MTGIPSIISHVSIGTNDFDRAAAFYDKVLADDRMQTHHGASRSDRLWEDVS